MTCSSKTHPTSPSYRRVMDQRLTSLAAMLEQTALVLGEISDEHLHLPTPCPDLDVVGMLDHLAVWVQVFDCAVNERPVGFDPLTHHVTDGWSTIFTDASGSIIHGLRERGVERMMTMVVDPLPGEFVLDMLLVEYVGHGWDLCRAVDRDLPYGDGLAEVSLTAARAIIEPQYRGTGLFGDEVPVPESASSMDRFVAFIGRDPQWSASRHVSSRGDE